ncbi:MAG TPA: hypothetical protein VFC35_08155 [Gemmatimonadaceae bacterium]|nr:hypothetical protein [Gemmatimonadaceae bacterium]
MRASRLLAATAILFAFACTKSDQVPADSAALAGGVFVVVVFVVVVVVVVAAAAGAAAVSAGAVVAGVAPACSAAEIESSVA